MSAWKHDPAYWAEVEAENEAYEEEPYPTEHTQEPEQQEVKPKPDYSMYKVLMTRKLFYALLWHWLRLLFIAALPLAFIYLVCLPNL